PQVTAFFNDDVAEADIMSVKQSLESKPYVASVTYVSKEEALRIYQEQNREDPLLLEMVSAEILPASLEVSAAAIDSLQQVKSDLESSPGVEEVAFQQDVVDALKRWSQGLQIAGLVIVGLLISTSILVM